MSHHRIVAVVWLVVGPGALGACGNSTSSETADGAPRAGPDAALDAESADVIPTTCAPFARLMLPDAEPNTCAFSPADVACTTDSDCKPYFRRGCASCGVFSAVGLSKMNTVNCPALPCAPPPQPVPPCMDSGFMTQDCQFVGSYEDIAVACVNQQCMTYVADAGSG